MYEDNDQDELHSGLKIFIDAGLEIGKSVDKNTKALRDGFAALQSNTPYIYKTVASGTYSSGTLLLNLGTPDAGTYWEVESITVGGTDLSVTAAGSAAVYVTAMSNNIAGTSSAMDYAATLPNVGFYGSRKLYIKEQENLIVGVWGGTANQVYVANAAVSVINDQAARGKAIDTI